MLKDSSKSFVKHCEQECALSIKQSGVPLEHYRINQNNPPPHTATSILLDIDVLGFGRVDHFPYSSYLSPFDFDVYPKVKSQLKGLQFSYLPEI